MDPILLEFFKSMAQSIAEKSIESLSNIIPSDEDAETSQNEIEPSLARHLTEVSNWSGRIEFYGLAQALSTECASIRLDMSSMPRKFTSGDDVRDCSEDDLLTTNRHILLIGDPGAGKSTTLKRICQTILSSPPTSDIDTIQYPLLIRLRQLSKGTPVQVAIAKAIGIKWTFSKFEENGREVSKRMIGNLDLEDAIIAVLEKTRPLICLDGLDEVSESHRGELESEIEGLAQKLQAARVLVTTRTGHFTRNISGLDVFEIKPLTESQIQEVVVKSVDNPTAFLHAINAAPYLDALSRPLSLIQAMVIFKNSGQVPEQPSDMYERITELYLEKWDSQNKVVRETKYTHFLPRKKMKYLASLAHFLLYKCGEPKIAFTHSDLELAYSKLHQRFGLSPNDVTLVNNEIETHTGILVEAREREFEFAHLSLQEYLAAFHLVRDQDIKRIFKRLGQYHAPIAVTLALGINPNESFANLFLHKDVQARLLEIESILPAFLQRLQTENVQFYKSGVLGFTMLSLGMTFVHNDNVCDQLESLTSNRAISESVSVALGAYQVQDQVDKNTNRFLTIDRSVQIGDALVLPEQGEIQARLLPENFD